MAKLDNEEYLLKKDGGTIPQNQVHEAFLYPDFERFLQSKCTINLDNSLLIRHENAIRLLAEEGYNIWGENVREEFNEFKNDVKDIILPEKNQEQQIEQEVQLTSHCTGSGQNDSCTSSFVVVKYFGHQKLTMQHKKKLNTMDIRPNQQMKKYLTAISDSLNRKSNEIEVNDMKYETHSKDIKEKAKLLIELEIVDSYDKVPFRDEE